MSAITVERRFDSTGSFALKRDGKHVTSVTFRDLIALVAVRAGAARAREHRRSSFGCWDVYLQPECDAYGVAWGTLGELQWHKLVTRPEQEGPLALTPLGDEILDAIAALPGVRLPVIDPSERPVAA